MEHFAMLLIKHPETQPYTHAMDMFGDTGEGRSLAYTYSTKWLTDPNFIKVKARIKTEAAEDDLLPTKTAYAVEILGTARKLRSEDPKSAIEYDKLYAAMRGHVEKLSNSTTVNVQMNRVMVQRDFGNDDEYAMMLEKQQAALSFNADADNTISGN
jgi:hypothetical protein